MLSGPRQKFAEGIVAGNSATAAYRAAYLRSGQRAAEVGASRLLRNAEVTAEIERQRATAEKQAGSALMTLMEKRMFLARVVRANVALLPPDSDLWIGVGTRRLRMPDKLRAIKLDNDLAGEGKGRGVKVRVGMGGKESGEKDDAFSELLVSIRK